MRADFWASAEREHLGGVKDFQAAAPTVTSPANSDCGLLFINDTRALPYNTE